MQSKRNTHCSDNENTEPNDDYATPHTQILRGCVSYITAPANFILCIIGVKPQAQSIESFADFGVGDGT